MRTCKYERDDIQHAPWDLLSLLVAQGNKQA